MDKKGICAKISMRMIKSFIKDGLDENSLYIGNDSSIHMIGYAVKA